MSMENVFDETVKQKERIKQMELRLERSAAALRELSAALDKYDSVQEDLKALDEYYGSSEWKQDYADDEAGRLPSDLKRGVLSEDGIWNLLSDAREMKMITELPSRYNHLEKMPVSELLAHINVEDTLVAKAVRHAIPQIQTLVEAVEPRMKRGGRLFYVGAGTSGRLGVLDASELPPTFGVSEDWVVGIIAGGDGALRHAVEKAEDDPEQGWRDVLVYHPDADDSVIGIAASGITPYVVGAVRHAKENGLLTGCITSNPDTPLAKAADCPVETFVGPEFVTGSSRMKSGTAQKMVLNMISTTLMIRMGRIKGNRMVKMQLTNAKLVDRGTRMLQDYLGLDYEEAQQRLLDAGSVDRALKEG